MSSHQAYLESPYRAADDAAARWERRSDELATVRPALVRTLADVLDCSIHARIEHRDILGLRRALGTWLDGLEDGELEDRLVVELDLLPDWARP